MSQRVVSLYERSYPLTLAGDLAGDEQMPVTGGVDTEGILGRNDLPSELGSGPLQIGVVLINHEGTRRIQ